MTDDGTGLMTIGELARTTGLPVRTIRYWSDEGALPPQARSAGGYRLYDAASAARLELIRTLRELGLGLDAVRRVLAGEATVAQVAAAHVSALDAQIGALRVTRAVLSSVARRGSTAEEMTLMNKLARLSTTERRRIIDDFMAEVFAGIDPGDPDIRTRLRFAAADLPDDPTSEQVDAWVELAELVQDPEFRVTMRRMIEFNTADRGADVPTSSSLWFVSRLVRLAGEALRDGVAPDAPRAGDVVRELIGDADPAVVLERLTAVTDVRLARYRELSAIVNGLEPPADHQERFGWVVAALGARTAG
ncbi:MULTISPECIES: MerR family transcriptional regulator [Streptomyces]|uniref:MerR family transcriptional regulator n=1 Tax=Streptomyces coelicoflavus TaxID=285562 RepID=A0A6N9UVE4_9ACTN|nr:MULTISPECIES: MerR family transcriptional regulator [Streptomyces]NEB21781.1 MerR family transcriptional regulator [Streptomyces coelicoflavus]OWA16987.1 MerR family transcriptional regulator [Streptomyces sp. CS159]